MEHSPRNVGGLVGFSLDLQDIPCTFFAIHIVSATVLFMSDGILGLYSAFVYSYAVREPLNMGSRLAGYLPSIFWAFITVGRLASIPVSGRLKPCTMVFINLGGIIGTFILMLCFATNWVCLFVGTGLLGFFLSSTFPSMLAYTEDVLNYKGCATTVLVTGACIGEMALQTLVGSVIYSHPSNVFLLCGLVFGCLALVFYLLLLLVHRLHIHFSLTGNARLWEGGNSRRNFTTWYASLRSNVCTVCVYIIYIYINMSLNVSFKKVFFLFLLSKRFRNEC
uniref:Major facilitator superfamily domain-containing protein 4A n=1 Tax=Callorhinchus milii TaxID=7868 RepID=A0A4W3J780_CALMI